MPFSKAKIILGHLLVVFIILGTPYLLYSGSIVKYLFPEINNASLWLELRVCGFIALIVDLKIFSIVFLVWRRKKLKTQGYQRI
jgi:hypothetical protein